MQIRELLKDCVKLQEAISQEAGGEEPNEAFINMLQEKLGKKCF